MRNSIIAAIAASVFALGSLDDACSSVVVVDGWTIIDNSFANDAAGTFVLSNPDSAWGTATVEPNDWNNEFRWNAAGAGNDTATWTFLGLPNGIYEVAVSYGTPHGNRATDSPYTINGGSPILVNQETVAAGTPTLSDGVSNIPFDTISTNASVTTGTLTVVLSDDANEFVIADSVAVRLIPEPSTGALMLLAGALGLRRRR